MIVISDTTPILSLLKAGKLDLLKKLYETVIVPEAVYNELTSNSDYKDESAKIKSCDFLFVEKVHNIESVRILRDVTGLDAGESESLVLYEEKRANVLLIDERKGRKVARQMAIEHIGTLGILMLAFDEGLVTAEEIRETLRILLACDIRLSRNLCNKVLDYIGSDQYF